MRALVKAYGSGITATILALSGLWLLILIVVPQMAMIEQSLWSREKSGQGLSLKIDRLYTERSTLDYDLKQLPTLARQGEIEQRIHAINTEISTLEAQEISPPKLYGIQNYTRMSSLHARIFVTTIAMSMLVTLLSLVVCYPVAYAVALASTPRRAAILMICLVIPYALNELLRIYAWLMILDYRGVINGMMALLGFVDFEKRNWIPFLDYPAAVFVAMVYAYILFMVFPILNALETIDRNQIEAARDLGASEWRIHWRVLIPHAKPGIAVGCIMTFMLSAGSYSVPQIMTRGTGGDWFSQLIYRQFFESYNWNIGSAYAFSLLIVCLIFVAAIMWLFKVNLRDIAR